MTPRQAKLLQAIIDDFIETADAVGSVHLANKYRLGVSPATIRNEMAELVELGYLDKPHSSSGRVPTNIAFRFFVKELQDKLEEIEFEIASGVYEKIFQLRFDTDRLIYYALTTLSKYSNNLALMIFSNRIYYSGLSNLITKPEFDEQEELEDVLNIIENYDLMLKIFNRAKSDRKVKVLIGDDTEINGFQRCSLVFSDIILHNNNVGYVSVIGPARMNYPRVIPLVEFVTDSMNKVMAGW